MRLPKLGRVIARFGPRVKRLHVQVSDDANPVVPTLCGIGFTSEARGCSVRPAKSIGMKAWPEFNAQGDLPAGLHLATLAEVLTHLGRGSPRRVALGRRLERIFGLVAQTGCLRRLAALEGEAAAVEHWQLKRDGSRRGIVEVMQHDQE